MDAEHLIFCPYHDNRNTPSCYYNTDKKTYYCHSCGAKGKLKDLAATLNKTEEDLMSDSTLPVSPIRDTGDYPGVNNVGRSTPHIPLSSDYVLACEAALHTKEGREGLVYLTTTRQLSLDIIKTYRIGYDTRNNVITIPNYWQGELLSIKVRPIDKYEHKYPCKYWQSSKNTQFFFGMDHVDFQFKYICITEGELDTVTIRQFLPNLNVISVPGKTSWQKLITIKRLKLFENFEYVYICFDNELKAEEDAEAIAIALGLHRCYRVKLPAKDANEVVRTTLKDKVAGVFSEALRSSQLFGEDIVKLAHDSVPDLITYAQSDIEKTLSTGFPILDQITGGFNLGTSVGVTGVSGTGKSTLAMAIAYHMIHLHKMPVLYCSFEMDYMTKIYPVIVSMATGVNVTDLKSLSPQQIEIYKESDPSHLLSYLQNTGTMPVHTLEGAIEKAYTNGVRFIIFDYIQHVISIVDEHSERLGLINLMQMIARVKNRHKDVILFYLSQPVKKNSQFDPSCRYCGKKHGVIYLADSKGSGAIYETADMYWTINRDCRGHYLTVAKLRSNTEIAKSQDTIIDLTYDKVKCVYRMDERQVRTIDEEAEDVF